MIKKCCGCGSKYETLGSVHPHFGKKFSVEFRKKVSDGAKIERGVRLRASVFRAYGIATGTTR